MSRYFLYLLFFVCFLSKGGELEDSSVGDFHNTLAGIEDFNDGISIQSLANAAFPFKSIAEIDPSARVHWLKFTLHNHSHQIKTLYLSVPFSDSVYLYSINDEKAGIIEKSGDLTPLKYRSEKTGQMVFIRFSLPENTRQTFLVKLKSVSSISSQFKDFTLGAVNLHSEASFKTRFENSRLIQAFFYGAVIIMLLYNFIIFLTLKYKSYFSYVVFIFLFIVFLSSNNGYLLELFWPYETRSDLFLRFLSAPLLICSFLIFSKIFLQLSFLSPRLDKSFKFFLLYFLLAIIIMLSGYWSLGRGMVIVGAVISFVFVIVLAYNVYRNGFYPAKYFLLANTLLLIGGIIYAMQRFSLMVENPISQYALQISSVIQLVLFSIGLADRINLAMKEVAEQKLALVQLEKKKEIEKKNLIEEKNKELEIKVEERTLSLKQKNEELLSAQNLIEEQNEELSAINTGLEEIVQSRTKELHLINDALEKSNQELDLFIYRTAHDIRGPLARVLGLCNVGLMEVADTTAIEYLKQLQLNAQSLNHIIARLSSVYEINNLKPSKEQILLSPLAGQILQELSFMEGFEDIKIDLFIKHDEMITGDKKLLKLILLNLLENGIKFQKKEGKDGFIELHVQKENQFIRINIIDNGVGISQEDTLTVFEMFSKAALKYKNAGLGLYMVKISVEKLEGSIGLVNNQNGLTEIQVKLPLN
ncbi:MAG TPA: sensor histidine kinase [Cytophagales bacterium]|nr:sensor histidine kinase [Cytophagales bacterium]